MTAALLLCLGLLISLSHAHIVPDRNEVTYQYEAFVSTYVENPNYFSSSFLIKYRLKIASFDTDSFVQIENVTYTMYSGKGSEPNDVFESIPSAARGLLAPFVITRNLDGKSVTIKTGKNEAIWSVDMKKGLASLLQVDTTRINRTKERSHGFVSSEYSVYGDCPVSYSVMPKINGGFTIKKIIDPTVCLGSSWKSNYSWNRRHCGKEYSKPLSSTTTHVYEIEEIDGNSFVSRIEGTNSIILAEFDGKSDGYLMKIRQKLIMVDSKKIEQSPMINLENMDEHKLKASFVQPDAESITMELSGGRGVYDLDPVPDKIIDGYKFLLKRLVNEDVTISYDNRDETVHYIMEQLRILDKHHLEVLFTKISTNATLLPLFIQSLPIMGTRVAALFIRDLIVEKKVSDSDAKLMLERLPFHLKHPNREMLKELMVLKNVTEPTLKTTIVLSLASIVGKALQIQPEDQFIQKSINDFINNFEASSEDDDRILYIYALSNTKSTVALNYIERIFADEASKYTPRIRSLAIWAYRNYEATVPSLSALWPIFGDSNDILEVRAAALSAIMTYPSLETLVTLQRMMSNETNGHLYSLYHTNLVSSSKSNLPCYEETASNARRILATARLLPPKNSNAVDGMIDYLNEEYNFGMIVKFHSLIHNNLASMRIESIAEIAGLTLNQNIEHFVTTRDSTDYNYVSHRISYQNDRAVSIIGISGESFKSYIRDSLIENMPMFIGYGNKDQNAFGLKVDGETILPTDLGTPAVFYLKMATASHLKNTDSGSREDKVLEVDHKQLNHQVYGLKVYNPVVDAWHGVRRNHVTEIRVPFNVHLKMSRGSIEVKFNTIKNNEITAFKYESDAFSQVYIDSIDDNQMKVDLVCKGCKAYNQVYGKDLPRNIVLWEHDSEETNTKFEFALFNCELRMSSSRLSHLKKSLFDVGNKNYPESMPSLKILMTIRHFWAYLATSPTAGRCGMKLTAKPHFTNSFTNIGVKDTNRHLSFRLNQTFRNGEKTKAWELSFQTDTSRRELEEFFIKFHVNYTDVAGRKICIDRMENPLIEVTYSSMLLVHWKEGNATDCNYDKPAVKVEVLGSFDENVADEHSFDHCYMSGKSLLTCVAEQTSFDKYTYNINYEGYTKDIFYETSPNRLIDYWKKLSENFRNTFSSSVHLKQPMETSRGHATAVVEYELHSTEPTLTMDTPESHIVYEKIPIGNTFWSQLFVRDSYQVPNSLFSKLFKSPLKTYTEYPECAILNNYLIDSLGHRRSLDLSSEWITMIKIDDVTPTSVQVRRNENTQLMETLIKTTFNDTKVEFSITSNGKHMEMVVNDEKLNTSSGYHKARFVDYKATSKSVILFFYNWSLLPMVVGENYIMVVHRHDGFAGGLCGKV